MTFLLVYLYVYCLIFLPMVMHMHIKLTNTFGNWLILPASKQHLVADLDIFKRDGVRRRRGAEGNVSAPVVLYRKCT